MSRAPRPCAHHGSDACGAGGSTPADLVFLYCTGSAIARLQRQLGAATKAPSSYAKRQQAYHKQKKQMHAKQGEEPNNGTLYFLMFFFGPPAAIALFRFIYL